MDTTTRRTSIHRTPPSKRRIASFAGLAAAILATFVLLGGCGDSTPNYAVTLTIDKPAGSTVIPDQMKYMRLTTIYQDTDGGFCLIQPFIVQTDPKQPNNTGFQVVDHWPWVLGMERGAATGGTLYIIIEGFGDANSANVSANAFYRQILQTTIPSKGLALLVLNIQTQAICPNAVGIVSAWNPDTMTYYKDPLFQALAGHGVPADQWPTVIKDFATCGQ